MKKTIKRLKKTEKMYIKMANQILAEEKGVTLATIFRPKIENRRKLKL